MANPAPDKKGGLNPNAKTFTFNPSASTWVQPSIAVNTQVDQEELNGKLSAMHISEQDFPQPSDLAADEDIDDSDPLWQVTLRIAKGDRLAAKKMLEDPDSLMLHPEVLRVIESTENADESTQSIEDDWEANLDLHGSTEKMHEDSTEKMHEDSTKKLPETKKEEPENLVENNEIEENEDCEEHDEVEAQIDEDPREHLNLVFIGHVDAGKSTLSGNILYLTDFVDKRTIERYEREAKQRNRESWFLAYIMDTNEEERAKGKTVEVGRAHFHSVNKRFTILDAPGHGAYVPNMIQGAAQADVGILVISARKGEFETGFERGGQTREHALLAKTLGVRYLIVAINKMDDHTVNWDKGRFDECCSKLKPFLRSCGYAVKKDVMFLPLSGLTGANVKDIVSEEICPWWHKMILEKDSNVQGGTLLKLFDELHMDNRDPLGPLRCPVLDRFTDRGTIALSKVEQGTLTTGSKIMIMPTKLVVRVEAVYINEVRVQSAKTGENVSVKLSCTEASVQKGYVLCDELRPCAASRTIMCQIALVELPPLRPIFSSGYEAIFHCHTAEEECTVTDLISSTDKKTGKVTKRPRFAKEGGMVVAVLKLGRNLSMEKFEVMSQLGRFTLRTEGKTIAIGKILNMKSE